MSAALDSEQTSTQEDFPQENCFRLGGLLLERDSLRYSPAGIALCDARIEHTSAQMEAGHERQVRLSIAARFAGVIAEKIASEALGSPILVDGFIAPKKIFRDGRASNALQMHVTAYEIQNQLR